MVYAKKVEEGQLVKQKLFLEEDKHAGNGKLIEHCITTTTYHYTDWYVNGVYEDSYLNYITETSVCNGGGSSDYLPDLSEQGGGGSGLYSSSGGGGEYNTCLDTVHGCLYDIDNKAKIADAEVWEEKIDDSQLNPCMQTIMSDVKQLTTGVGQILTKFAGNKPGYNWTVVDGNLPQNSNAETSPQYNFSTKTVTTSFDSNKFGNATDLSIARTILHEAVHAYLVAWEVNTPTFAGRIAAYPMLMQDYAEATVGTNLAQHNEMIRFFVSHIAKALQEYGKQKGFNYPSQFFNDLAWGGLTHTQDSNGNIVEMNWFKALVPDANDRKRISDVINIELTGKDFNGSSKTQKGNDAGC